MHPKFTIFTPTYNRSILLNSVYNCLKSQTNKSFEWLIVDGGDDDTASLVSRWQDESDFSIRYIRQSSTGLHGAYNEGARYAKAPLFLIMHSDDSCVPNTLDKFLEVWAVIPEENKKDYSGVWARCIDSSGQMIGELLPSNLLDSTLRNAV